MNENSGIARSGPFSQILSYIVIMLRRNRVKTQAALTHRNKAEEIIYDELMYEDLNRPILSVSVFNTQDNVTYGHTNPSTTAVQAEMTV